MQGRIPELIRLAAGAALPLVELGGIRVRSRAGNTQSLDDLAPAMTAVLGELPPLGADDDRTFADLLARARARGLSASAADLARQWVESYDAAHPDRVSVRFLERERAAEEQIEGHRTFRLVTGYDGIARALHARISSDHGVVELQTIATDVHWERTGVTVEAHCPHGATCGSASIARSFPLRPHRPWTLLKR